MAEYDGRIRRLHPVPNRDELEQLSPEELAQAMEQTLDQMTEDTYDQAVIDAYLDALDAKAPMPEALDVEKAYGQFQSMLSKALPTEESPRRKRRGAVLRITLRVALAAAFLFGCLMMAQAGGVDVFGAVARWTDDAFYLETQKDHTAVQSCVPYQEKYESAGLDAAYMPTWIPDGYSVGEIEVDELTTWTYFYIPLNNSNGSILHFCINIQTDSQPPATQVYEKDDRPVQQYQINGKTVYLFHNLDIMAAVCQDETVTYSLYGDFSEDMVLQFFNSIPSISSNS